MTEARCKPQGSSPQLWLAAGRTLFIWKSGSCPYHLVPVALHWLTQHHAWTHHYV